MAVVNTFVDIDIELGDIATSDLMEELIHRWQHDKSEHKETAKTFREVLVQMRCPTALQEIFAIFLRGDMNLGDEYSLWDWCSQRRKGEI